MTLSVAEAAARLLSFVFYLVAARALAPVGFGEMRYTIALVLILYGPLQVLSHALTRQLGTVRRDNGAVQQVLNNATVVSAIVLLSIAAVTSMLCAAGVLGRAEVVPTLVVLVGYSAFQLYYSAARGLGDLRRAATTYIGGSMLQLVALGVALVVADVSATEALLIFGLSSIVPVILWEAIRPLVRGRVRISASASRELWIVGAPLIIAQIGFVVWYSADQVWSEAQLSSGEAGLFAAAKNLTQVFMVLPAAAGGILIPQVAQYRSTQDARRALRIVVRIGLGGFAVSVAAAAILSALRSDVLDVLYGGSFGAAATALGLLAIAMAVYFPFSVIATGALGWGEPRVFAIGMGVAAVAECALLPVIGDSAAGVAGAVAVSITVGTCAMCAYAAQRFGRSGKLMRATEQAVHP